MNVNLTLRYEENQMEIKHKTTGEVLLVVGGDTLRGANLEHFDLQYADLKGVDLERANLRGADLRGANLQGANLRNADLQDAKLPTNITRINGMKWDVTIFQDWMTIGCQHHHIDDWNKFTDDEIAEMDDGALEFWKENKDKLITIANLTK